MPHSLEYFSLENFRNFNKLFNFKINQLTILTGTNSSGKSSVTKALLLLKENVKSHLNVLDFFSSTSNLGDYSQVKSRLSKKRTVFFRLFFIEKSARLPNNISTFQNTSKFSLKFENMKGNGRLISLQWDDGQRHEQNIGSILYLAIVFPSVNNVKNNLHISFNIKHIINKYSDELARIRSELPIEFKCKGSVIGIEQDDVTVQMSEPFYDFRAIPDEFLKSYKTIINSNKLRILLGIDLDEKVFSRFIIILNEHLISFLSNIDYNKHGWESTENYKHTFGSFEFVNISLILSRYFEHTRYLLFEKKIKELSWGEGIFNFRVTPDKDKIYMLFNDVEDYSQYFEMIKEKYISEIIDENFLAFFEKFLYPALGNKLSEYFESLSKISFLEAVKANSKRLYSAEVHETPMNEILNKFASADLNDIQEKFLTKWLKLFEIGDDIKVKRVASSFIKVIVYRKDEKIDLSDLGYGIVQFIPILLKLVTDFPVLISSQPVRENIFIIEEPETNFHPRFQSLLADFFIDALKHFDIKIIIETHSEYLIRKLQYLTAKKEIKPEDSVIYYFNHQKEVEKGAEQVKELHIREDGMMDGDFGPGFFDESTRLTVDLLKLQNKN